jgi:hypothetical protein
VTLRALMGDEGEHVREVEVVAGETASVEVVVP